MLNILDIYERAVEGQAVGEEDFILDRLAPNLKRLADEYGIRYDRNHPVPCYDDPADALYAAALEFVSRAGVYCRDTGRIIEFSCAEIQRAVRDATKACAVGEGRDAGLLKCRRPDDGEVPWLHVGSGIVASNEAILGNLVEAYGLIAESNSISIPALNNLRGIPTMAGTPVELLAAVRSVGLGREALRRAGRPGLPIMNLISTATSAVGTIAASAPQFGLRPSDGWLVGAPAEMKIDFGTMNKLAYLHSWGANVGAEAGAILGGYAGGPEATAILSTAYILVGLLIHRASYHLAFPIHIRHACSTSRDTLWVVASSCQAVSRNVASPVIWLGYASAGPGTPMYCYEAAAHLLAAVTSGAAGVQTPHPARAVKVDGITPLEARFGVDVSTAAAQLNRSQANALVLQLLEQYESDLKAAPVGVRYTDCYDTRTGRATDGSLRLYDQIRGDLRQLGLPIR